MNHSAHSAQMIFLSTNGCQNSRNPESGRHTKRLSKVSAVQYRFFVSVNSFHSKWTNLCVWTVKTGHTSQYIFLSDTYKELRKVLTEHGITLILFLSLWYSVLLYRRNGLSGKTVQMYCKILQSMHGLMTKFWIACNQTRIKVRLRGLSFPRLGREPENGQTHIWRARIS